MSDVITVLVVEDEPILRLFMTTALEDAGFRVLEAKDASEAIHALTANPSIQVMFTDIDMPGDLNGLKLAAMVRNRWPPIKIIITSGHHQVDLDVVRELGPFIPKPYVTDEIVNAIYDLVQ